MKRQRRRMRAAYLGRQSLCVPDLKEDPPLADWALQQQSPLQLDHGMTTKAQTHCLPRQKDANNDYLCQDSEFWSTMGSSSVDNNLSLSLSLSVSLCLSLSVCLSVSLSLSLSLSIYIYIYIYNYTIFSFVELT